MLRVRFVYASEVGLEPNVENHWVSPPPLRPDIRGRLSPLGCLVLVAGLPWAVFVSSAALKLWSDAASDCRAFDAGNRFAVWVLYWPAFTVALWVVFAVSVLLLAKRSLLLGIAFGVALTLGIAYAFLGGTADTILNAGGGDFCPTGLPDWWPVWAPR